MWKLIFLFALSTATLSAQTFRAAALVGLNLSQLDGDDLLGFHQPGLNAGLRVVAVLDDHWRVGPEILFSQQGAKRNTNSVTQSAFDAFRFQTVELPVMVHYHDWRLTAEAGVSYQRLLSYRVVNTLGEDVTDDVHLQDDALVLHLGATLDLSPRLGLHFRWSRHLTNQQAGAGPRFVSRSLTFRAVYTIGRATDLPQ
ncbi:porin family protein [Neolewinella sp.]|uniref:porin family protein n=1 Tax=Neolewinella sp. TaxID=2993543 RepID=UPI003B522E6B